MATLKVFCFLFYLHNNIIESLIYSIYEISVADTPSNEDRYNRVKLFSSDNDNDVSIVRKALSDVELLESLLMRKIVSTNT